MELFHQDLITYICGNVEHQSDFERTSRLINKSEKSDFDFNFPGPSKINIWKKCASIDGKEPSFEGLINLNQEPSNVDFSKSFIWPISAVRSIDSNIFLKLDRTFVCNSIIKQICTQGIVVTSTKDQSKISLVNCEFLRKATPNSIGNLNKLRVSQVCLALQRLLSTCNYNVSKDDAKYNFKVGLSDANHLKKNPNDFPLKVGQVVDKNPNKIKDIYNLTDLYDLIFDKMASIARERDAKCSEYELLWQTKIVASSEIQVLLLSKNIDRAVTLPNLEKQSDAASMPSDASFMLYNYARIVQLLKAFSCRKEKYGDILPIDEVEFTYLLEQEEWNIVFNALIPYQELIREISSLQFESAKSQENINKCLSQICLLLIKLSNVYSKYYRRVRVLREGPQSDSVIQVLNARLYLLMAIKTVYDHAFYILDIHPINAM